MPMLPPKGVPPAIQRTQQPRMVADPIRQAGAQQAQQALQNAQMTNRRQQLAAVLAAKAGPKAGIQPGQQMQQQTPQQQMAAKAKIPIAQQMRNR